MAKTSDTRFNWSDPLLLDQQLTHEEQMVRDTARAYCQDKLAPRVLEMFRHEKTDPSIFREMGALDLLGIVIPEAIRRRRHELRQLRPGRARDRARRFRLPLDDERAGLAGHGADQRVRHRGAEAEVPAEAGDRRVDRLLRPDRAEHGSDPGGMTTRAKKVDGGYSLTGTKSWISNSPIADVFIIWAKDDEDKIRGFILEKGMKGLSAPPIHGKVGLRTSLTGEIVMDNVFCPEENAFPDVRGLKGPFTCLNSARYGICWGALGAAEDCWHRARNYVMERKQFGRPLAANQLIQKKLADMQTEIALGLQARAAAGPHEGRGHRRAGDHVDAEAQLVRQGARHRARWPATCSAATASSTSSASSATWSTSKWSTPTKARTTCTR